MLSPPKGLVPWLRWLGLFLAISVAAGSLPLLTIATSAPVQRTAAVIAAGLLVACWLVSYLSDRVPAWADVVGPLALLVIGLELDTVVNVLPLAIAAAAYRGLWGDRRRVLLAAGLQGGALLLASLATTAVSTSIETLVVGLVLLVLAALATHEVAAHLAVHDRATRHRQVLTDAAGELLGVSEPADIAGVALRALRGLLGPDAPVAVALCGGGDLVTVAAEDRTGPLKVHRRLPLGALPGTVRERLERGELCHTHALAADGVPTGLTGAGTTFVPLMSHGVLRGAVLVRGAVPDDDVRTVLSALVSEAALALESATLTADLRASESRFRSLVQNSSDLIAIITDDARIRYVSPASQHVIGYAPELVQGADLATVVHPDDLPVWRHFITADAAAGGRWSTTCRLKHRSGTWRHMEVVATDARAQPGVGGIVLNMRDVTEQVLLEADLRRQATHDPLTSLPNRSLFMDRVRGKLTYPQQDSVALLFIDLDNFKVVNDRFGHAVGDDLLCSVARRLGSVLNGHTLARLGGDEFAVLADAPGGRQQAETLAQDILDALETPMRVTAEEVRTRASVGVALGDAGADDAGDLLRRADLAMYVAKGEGKSRFAVFDERTYRTLSVQRRLQAELGAALEAAELEVRYQPIVDLDTLEVCSAEALVRWHHPTYGLLGPSTFIHLAEEEGLLSELFQFVLREACLQARTWNRNLCDAGSVAVSVNLAPQQLEDERLLECVQHAVEGAGLPADLLTLELTENVLVSDPQRAARVMRGLKRLGVALAVDDFGTGYSSLAYLRRLPVDVLKIDQAFIEGLGRPDSGSALLRTIVELGRELGLRTVAEGVERPEQREALRRLGCGHAQGFLFARPLAARDFRELLARGVHVAERGAVPDRRVV